MFKFELGVELQELVTGFKGIAMSRTEYYTGCRHYALCPRQLTKEGKEADWYWVDESRLTQIGNGIKKTIENKTKPISGIFPNAPKH